MLTEARTPQHLPIGSLKSYGTNLYGDALFRVVWSESRDYMVGARHKDYDESAGGAADDKTLRQRGKDPNLKSVTAEYRRLPLYPGARCWILEVWKSAQAFTGCTPQMYHEQYFDPRSGLLTLGPYPDRGEYVECFRFPNEPPISAVIRVINAIKAGWNYTFSEHKQAIAADQEAKQKAVDNRRQDIFLDSQQAFKNRPSNIRPGKRTKDHIRFGKTAAQTGINQRGFSTAGR